MQMTKQNIIDLRSDTVTHPTPEMYEAIRNAPLGDDVLDGDPTVRELEKLAAKTLGKEAGLFVPSGCMSNQLALASHTNRGDSILLEEESHILFYEGGSPALIAQVNLRTIPSKNGIMEPNDIEHCIIPKSFHTPGTSLICIENTHNRAGGTIIPIDHLKAYKKISERTNIPIHLDGARLFNAAIALGVKAETLASYADSVSICLSKGLCAPVGSVLCGTCDYIEKAKLWRKRLGGGMRQAGILAACGIVSLTNRIDRLADDHKRAKYIANQLSQLPEIYTEPNLVQTNIVMVHTEAPANQWVEKLHSKGVLALPFKAHTIRLVLHADITDEMADHAIAAFQ